MARDSFDKVEVADALWNNVAIPSLLYGIECIPISKTHIKKLESAQRNVAKWILGLDRNSAGIGAITEMGWKSMNHRIREKQLQLYVRLKYLENDNHLVKKAFLDASSGAWKCLWLEEIGNIKKDINVLEIPEAQQPKKKLKAFIKREVNTWAIKVAIGEINQMHTLIALPKPKRRSYIEDYIIPPIVKIALWELWNRKYLYEN